MSLEEIEKQTTTVEDFIQECLNQDIDYEVFFEYLKTSHNG